MKKFTKLLACATLLFTASACSSSKIQDDAITKLESGIKNIATMKSFDYTIDLTSGEEHMDGISFGSLLSQEKTQFSLAMNIPSATGSTMSFLEVYLKDDVSYLNIFGQKQKQLVGATDLSKQIGNLEAFHFTKENAEKLFDEASVDGEKVHLVVKKELIQEGVAKLNSTQTNNLAIDKINEVTLDIEFEDDFIKSTSLSIDGLINNIDQKMIFVLHFQNINKVESILFPEDLDTYIEAEGALIPGTTN